MAPLNAFTEDVPGLLFDADVSQVLLRDFGLLEEVDAAVDRADRDLRIRDEATRRGESARWPRSCDSTTLGATSSAFSWRVHVRCRRGRRGAAQATEPSAARLILAPYAMTIARENTSRVVQKGPEMQLLDTLAGTWPFLC